jgi:hypothetical protein
MAQKNNTDLVKNKTGIDKTMTDNALLLNAAVQMSWRLAIVVLVPLIAGVKLDQHYKIFPYLTITGSILAIVGIYYVLSGVLKEFGPTSNKRTGKIK